jgi:hypothetical protein
MIAYDPNVQRKFCPTIMCSDGQVQDQRTCQCRPVAKTVPAELTKDLTRFGDLLGELCGTIPQLMHPQACLTFPRQNRAGFTG